MEPETLTPADHDLPRDAASNFFALEFYSTKGGQHRAKLGVGAVVENVASMVEPVLYSEARATAEELGADLAALLESLPTVVLIGPVPEAFRLPPAPEVKDRGWDDALIAFDGRVFDRRQLRLMVELDRRNDSYVDRRARLIWQRMSDGESFSSALASVNSTKTPEDQLTLVAGYKLALESLYRLGLHVAMVNNRQLAPAAEAL